MDLLSWWNLIFLLPALAALLYLILLATGTVSVDTGDADAELAADIDLDADTGELHGIEQVIGEAPDGAQPSGALRVLTVIGVGRVPLSLLLLSFSFLWGFLGWVGNSLFSALFPSPQVFVWPSIALALIGALVLTRLLAIGLHRIMPATETYVVGNRQLVGRLATVRYAVTERTGTAQLYDDQGRLHEVPVRVLSSDAPIPAQSHVVLWRYDAADNVFLVTPEHDLDEAPAKRRQLQAHEEVN